MGLAGWNDASQGPLLPTLQRIYNVDYLVSEYFNSNVTTFCADASLHPLDLQLCRFHGRRHEQRLPDGPIWLWDRTSLYSSCSVVILQTY